MRSGLGLFYLKTSDANPIQRATALSIHKALRGAWKTQHNNKLFDHNSKLFNHKSNLAKNSNEFFFKTKISVS